MRAKLFVVSLAAIVLAVGIAHTYLSRTLEGMLAQRIEDDLSVRAGLVARDVAAAPLTNSVAGWQALADELGRSAHV
jgi:hypothetical protein